MGIVGAGRMSKRILSLFVGNRRMSTCSSISPCLVLQPHFMHADIIYKFYSLENERAIDWTKRGGGGGGGGGGELVPADESKIVGSSHGWLALFNENNNDLFLSDPWNRRHIKLPSIDKLPDPELNLIGGRGTVSKLILSCSPDHDGVQGNECRALMSYGAGDRLAFCSPLSSTSWIPVGDLSAETTFLDGCHQSKSYQDFVYCTRRKAFSCVTPYFKIDFFNGDVCQDRSSNRYGCQLEELDMSPKWIRREPLPNTCINDDDEPMPSWVDKMDNLPIQTSHLVYAEDSNKLYLLVRFFQGSPPVPYNRLHDNCYLINDPYVISKYGQDFPYKTVGFLALRFDEDEDGYLFLSVANNLNGLAMFVGLNHSFAISASKFPELNLNPNSIYFTDVGSRIKGPVLSSNEYKGRDVGIFDYKNNVVLPWFDESSQWVPDVPVWLTPNMN